MTLEKTLRHNLREAKLDGGAQEICVVDADSGWEVSFNLHRHDDLSSLVGEINLRGTNNPRTTLRSWAERIASQVTGLLQPLKVLEIDGERNQGILRSLTLTEIADQPVYFELFLEGTSSARLRRFQVLGNKREAIPFALTHETFVKLVQDIAGAR